MIEQCEKVEYVEGYEAAGHYVVDHSDILFAVWDGKKANGKGGTAEIVSYAREQSKRVVYFSIDGKSSSCSY